MKRKILYILTTAVIATTAFFVGKNFAVIYVRGHKCFKFTYSINLEYQDGNGATYDTVTESWID